MLYQQFIACGAVGIAAIFSYVVLVLFFKKDAYAYRLGWSLCTIVLVLVVLSYTVLVAMNYRNGSGPHLINRSPGGGPSGYMAEEIISFASGIIVIPTAFLCLAIASLFPPSQFPKSTRRKIRIIGLLIPFLAAIASSCFIVALSTDIRQAKDAKKAATREYSENLKKENAQRKSRQLKAKLDLGD